MKVIRLCTTVLGRFLMSLVFLAAAVNKILHWHDTERGLLNLLCEWQSNAGFSDHLHDCLATLVPWAPLLLVAATLCELMGGLSILLGIKEKWGAMLLFLFLIPTTFLYHAFWFVDGAMREAQITHFLKNLAIMGGLLMIVLQERDKGTLPFPTKFG
jgi:putative oxidoreductase